MLGGCSPGVVLYVGTDGNGRYFIGDACGYAIRGATVCHEGAQPDEREVWSTDITDPHAPSSASRLWLLEPAGPGFTTKGIGSSFASKDVYSATGTTEAGARISGIVRFRPGDLAPDRAAIGQGSQVVALADVRRWCNY